MKRKMNKGYVRASRYFGKDYNYFSVVKKTTPEKFEFIQSFDEDLLKAVDKYDNYVQDLINKVTDIRYGFDRDKDLFRWLVKIGVAKAESQSNNVIRDLDGLLFNSKKDNLSVKFSQVKRLEKIIKEKK